MSESSPPPPPGPGEVGATLAAMLNERYRSQSAAAHALGVPRGTLARAMKGDQLPGAPLLQALAVRGFDVTRLLLAQHSIEGNGRPEPVWGPVPADLKIAVIDAGIPPLPADGRPFRPPESTIPLFPGLLPTEPNRAAGRAARAVAVDERWVRPGAYAVWTREAAPPVILAGNVRPSTEVPQFDADVLVVWTRDVPRWTSADRVEGSSRSGPRRTFLAKTEAGWKYLMPPVVLDGDGVPFLSLAHDAYAAGDGEPGDAADAVARPQRPDADGPAGETLRVVGFVTHLFGNYRPL